MILPIQTKQLIIQEDIKRKHHLFYDKQEAVKASNSPRDRKNDYRMAKKTFEGWQLFSDNDIFLIWYAFNRYDVGRRNVLPTLVIIGLTLVHR